MRKLFTLMAVLAITSFFSVKADWVKNVTLANQDFTTITTSPFTTANSNLSGNSVGAPTILNGYMYTSASGSGNRGIKITNMTAADTRTDTVYYEFDWNPYQIAGQANSTGTSGIYPDHYGVCVVRGSNDSIVFGLMYERWSLKAGSKYNTDSINKTPLGDIHLMNLSTDPNNPVPASIVTQTKPDLSTWSYYTNTLLPFAMLDLNYSSSYYAVKCDSINQSTDIGRTFKMNRWYHIKAVMDFMNKKIISFEIYEKDAPANKATFTNLPFVNTGANNASRLEIAATRGKNEGATSGASCNYEQRFDNFDVYTMHEVAAAAPVTIRYKDANGVEIKTARVVENQEINTVYTASASDKVTIIFEDNYYTYDETSVDNVTVQLGGSEITLKFIKATPKNTILTLNAPSSSELYKDVTIDITVKTPQDEIVSSGDVLLYVNNLVKNRVTVDVLGKAKVVMPNLLVGDENIAAVYLGDHINYSNSDTTKTVISITPSTATVKPYPVYFDLCDQPEIIAWERERGVTTATPRSYTHYFRTDSLSGITVTDTINETHKVGYYLAGSTYDKIDNAYNRADFVMVPLGSSRPTWVKFKTPWLNAGSYNIYISHRVSGDPKTNMTTITMDDKEVYFPNEEMYGRWFKSWMGVNNRRQWNAKAHSGSMGMNYIGSVSIDNSGTHSLKINVLPENGATYNLDMLQFIPVDMDSLNINLPAATSMAKTYYPLFDWVGFARQPGYDVAAVPTTYADYTQFAIPYQVADQTDWGKKFSHTIDSIGLVKKLIGTDEYVANYVTIYRAEDKWTRVAEGYGNETTFDFTCELPVGNYYYETINYTDLGDGAQDYRTFISSGTFSVSDDTAIDSHNSSSIKVFANNKTLTVAGISAGARILVADLTGRILVNEVSKSTLFAKQMPQGVYVVKVLSGEVLRTKVIVK